MSRNSTAGAGDYQVKKIYIYLQILIHRMEAFPPFENRQSEEKL